MINTCRTYLISDEVVSIVNCFEMAAQKFCFVIVVAENRIGVRNCQCWNWIVFQRACELFDFFECIVVKRDGLKSFFPVPLVVGFDLHIDEDSEAVYITT